MPKLKAKREGTLVYLPKYVNAEMLMLEFFRGDTFAITPQGNALVDGDADNYTAVQIHQHVDILDGLLVYIDDNTPND